MSRAYAIVVGLALFAGFASAAESAPRLTDAQVRKVLIEESRSEYSGNCACPYDTDRAGRRCGKRSAYNRPRGAAPLCFDKDVTPDMVKEYRSKQAAKSSKGSESEKR